MARQSRATAETPTVAVDDGGNVVERINQNSLILKLTLGAPGTRKKVKANEVKVSTVYVSEDGDPDKDALSISKEVLACDELKAVTDYQGQIRDYVASQCVPSFLRPGMYRIKLTEVKDMVASLKEMRDLLLPLIEDFLRVYPSRIEADKKRLKGLFNPANYPSVERMRSLFYMEWSFFEWTVPGSKLSSISEELMQEEQQKAIEQGRRTAALIENHLWTEFLKLTEHIVERLTPGEDGKAKKFHDTLVENLTDFLDTINSRNLTENPSLQSAAARARQVMTGVTPDTWRSNDIAKERGKQFFAQLKEQLAQAVQDVPTRAYLED